MTQGQLSLWAPHHRLVGFRSDLLEGSALESLPTLDLYKESQSDLEKIRQSPARSFRAIALMVLL